MVFAGSCRWLWRSSLPRPRRRFHLSAELLGSLAKRSQGHRKGFRSRDLLACREGS